MKKEELIKKWLDNALSPQEFEAFKALEDYEELSQLSNALQAFKAPEYNTSEELEAVLPKLKKPTKTNWFASAAKVAAIFVICFGMYHLLQPSQTIFSTQIAQQTTINLPDNSEVFLNSESQLSYNEKNWNNNRFLDLKGEAYFKVEKGQKFTVNTTSGTVTVLGTQFTVKNRPNYFEVICYEGSVKVETQSQNFVLKAGNSVAAINNSIFENTDKSLKNPSWINHVTTFKSVPFNFVVNELQRQYNVTIDVTNIDNDVLFSGSFTHKNLDKALRTITIPLGLKYSMSQNNIVLTRE